eukprot:COSAG06_NODE_12605_length_1356_cov_1.870326_1_plen_88_part_10
MLWTSPPSPSLSSDSDSAPVMVARAAMSDGASRPSTTSHSDDTGGARQASDSSGSGSGSGSGAAGKGAHDEKRGGWADPVDLDRAAAA